MKHAVRISTTVIGSKKTNPTTCKHKLARSTKLGNLFFFFFVVRCSLPPDTRTCPKHFFEIYWYMYMCILLLLLCQIIFEMDEIYNKRKFTNKHRGTVFESTWMFSDNSNNVKSDRTLGHNAYIDFLKDFSICRYM